MRNSAEIRKFSTISLVWLSITFLAVWAVCWLVGIALPLFLLPALGITDPIWGEVCKAITPIVAILVFIPINATFMVLFERRGLALFTVRSGPNRVGPDGFLQTAADALKLLLKEDITPRGADIVLHTLAPITFFAPSIFAALPLLAAVTDNHPIFRIVNLPTGIFYVLAASSIPVVGIVMGGWASNNKYSLVGGLRSAAQAISYEIPLVLSIIAMCMMAKTLDVVQIVQQQAGGFWNWNLFGGGALRGLDRFLFYNNSDNVRALQIFDFAYGHGIWSLVGVVLLIICTIIMALLYLTGACAEINRIPFDLPEAESELVSGYNTEYSGMKFAIFFLAEFTNLFIVSSIFVVMFLGGGDCPLPFERMLPFSPAFMGPLYPLLVEKLQLVDPATLFAALWIIIKTYLLVFFAILIRGTLPRFRIDQLMDFGWKRLIPLALITFMVMVFAREMVHVQMVFPGGTP